AGSLSSYKKVVKDLEKRAKRGEKIPKGTIEHHKNVIKEFEKEIRKLQKFILMKQTLRKIL
ncbi:MAG: hypothetical protein NZ839_04580, partial [Endomicrobia bacterium]|nr:hypothetical protein [Endomicrobiia bacterium]